MGDDEDDILEFSIGDEDEILDFGDEVEVEEDDEEDRG